MGKQYKKLKEGEFEIIETITEIKEKKRFITLEQIDNSIAHYDRQLADIEITKADIEAKKAEEVNVRKELLKL